MGVRFLSQITLNGLNEVSMWSTVLSKVVTIETIRAINATATMSQSRVLEKSAEPA